MHLVFFHNGVKQAARDWFQDENTANWTMGLYKTSLTPARGDTESSYVSAECDFTGYSRASMGSPSDTGLSGDFWTYTFGQVTFTVGSTPSVTNDAYGIFIYDTDRSEVIAAARFDTAPLTMDVSGEQIKVTLTVSTYSFYP